MLIRTASSVSSSLFSYATWSGGDLDSALQSALESGLQLGGSNLSSPGTLSWVYDVSSVDLDFLAAGEIVELTYQVTVTDELGATATDEFVVTINGSNDAPTCTEIPFR